MSLFTDLRRLFRQMKIRTVLSIISVAIGVTSVVLIGYIGDTGTRAVNSELDNLGMDGLTITANTKLNTGCSLKESELEALQANKNVQTAEPLLITDSTVQIHDETVKTTLFGVQENPAILKLDLLFGRKLKTQDIKSSANVCMIDEELAKKLYQRTNIVGKVLTISVNGQEDEYKVIGIVKSGSGILNNIAGSVLPSFLYVPYTTYQRVTNKDTLDRIAVKIKEGENIDRVTGELIRTLEHSTGYWGSYESQNLSNQRESLGNLLNIVTLILSLIGGISLVVAGLGIMTVMLVSVSERTREIGIKKAIGAKNHKILGEFILEAFTIALIGCVIGIGAGTLIAYIGTQLLHLDMIFSYQRYLICLLVSVFIGCVFGAYPAYKAARLKPVDALRRE